jgi:hypothetical protein
MLAARNKIMDSTELSQLRPSQEELAAASENVTTYLLKLEAEFESSELSLANVTSSFRKANWAKWTRD